MPFPSVTGHSMPYAEVTAAPTPQTMYNPAVQQPQSNGQMQGQAYGQMQGQAYTQVQGQTYTQVQGPNHVQGTTISTYSGGGQFAFVQNKRQFMIRQKFEMMEAAAQALGFDCIEQKNKYDIYDAKTGESLMLVKEDSETCMRCCCHPNHQAKLFVFDTRHHSYSAANKPKTSMSPPHASLAMTVNKPCKLNCCTCANLCMHEQQATLAGAAGTPIGSANKEFPCGGGCTPVIEVKDKNDQVYAKVVGPFFIVGGLIELISSVKFKIKDPKTGQVIGALEKKKPKGTQRLQEAVGDADQFMLTLPETFSDEQTANFVATLLLLDYIFFEGGAPFEYNAFDNSCKINCWNW